MVQEEMKTKNTGEQVNRNLFSERGVALNVYF